MDSTNLLLKPGFWYLFTAIAIILLFLYGKRMSGDTSELVEGRRSLLIAKNSLDSCSTENAKMVFMIKSLNNEITRNQNIISALNDSIHKLYNKPVDTVVKYEYKDKSEPMHPYGKGYGKVSFFKLCNCYGLKLWIDGEYAGQINTVSKSTNTTCDGEGSLNKILLAGKHHILAKDMESHNYDFYISINENECCIKRIH